MTSIPSYCTLYPRKELASKRYGYFEQPPTAALTQGDAGFVILDSRFHTILGDSPLIYSIAEDAIDPFAHEAGVYIPSTGDVFVTSNQIRRDGKKHVGISKVTRARDTVDTAGKKPYSVEEIHAEPAVHLANGGVNYRDGILFCEQGFLTEPGGLTYMSLKPNASTGKYTTINLLSNYHGRWFNSVNDVVVHDSGSIWFTDPPYGFEQGIRPLPQLPVQTYCFDPATGAIRAVEDSLEKPNGLCFSPDQKTLYITNTAGIRGDPNCAGLYSPTAPASIYAFDVVERGGAPFLTNKRLFAFADQGIPDGIKCDREGNVYSGCGDGVHVWATDGTLIGKIYVPGGCANFCFGAGGEMFLLNEKKMWRAQLSDQVKGDLLGI